MRKIKILSKSGFNNVHVEHIHSEIFQLNLAPRPPNSEF